MKELYQEIALRLKELREIFNYSQEDMARLTQTDLSEYKTLESGDSDFGFTFLHKAAKALNVDITDLIQGESPKLSTLSIVKNGQGLPIKRRIGFDYQSLAYRFKNKIMEPFLVKVAYHEEALTKPIPLSTHEGQEMDYVLEGELLVSVDSHVTILGPGDCIYYDSGKPHGMVAHSKEGVTFLAIVADNNNN